MKSRLARLGATIAVALCLTSIFTTPILAFDLTRQGSRIADSQAEIHSLVVQRNSSATQAKKQEADAIALETFYLQAVQSLCAKVQASCPLPPTVSFP